MSRLFFWRILFGKFEKLEDSNKICYLAYQTVMQRRWQTLTHPISQISNNCVCLIYSRKRFDKIRSILLHFKLSEYYTSNLKLFFQAHSKETGEYATWKLCKNENLFLLTEMKKRMEIYFIIFTILHFYQYKYYFILSNQIYELKFQKKEC